MLEQRTKEFQDADGNRGVYVYDFSIDEDDGFDITQQVIEQISSDIYEYNDEVEIMLMSEYTDELIPFDVVISEYVTLNEFNILQGAIDEGDN